VTPLQLLEQILTGPMAPRTTSEGRVIYPEWTAEGIRRVLGIEVDYAVIRAVLTSPIKMSMVDEIKRPGATRVRYRRNAKSPLRWLAHIKRKGNA